MRMDRNKNQVILRGIVQASPTFSHKVHGIDFFQMPLCVPRLSGREDLLNIVIPDSLLADDPLSPGVSVEITGEVRSFNNRTGTGNRLVITVLAHTIEPQNEPPCNLVQMTGVLCKPPILRRTPLGRDICDFLLAVNRRYHRADYLPCIAWGTIAKLAAELDVGDCISLEGRLQSRVYLKTTDEGSIERTAFEISVMSLTSFCPS